MPRAPVVFLLDVDNTLLDNDRLLADLRQCLERELGADGARRYWEHHARLWAELGYADYLGALQAVRRERPHEDGWLEVSLYMASYPFADLLFPESRNVLAHLQAQGPVVLLTDGDAVWQPRKVERSGLLEAACGQVLIYIHKEEELADVERRHPADRYVMVDDKLRLLAPIKAHWRERVTTVFVRQGQYAKDASAIAALPAADLAIERIGDLLRYDADALRPSSLG